MIRNIIYVVTMLCLFGCSTNEERKEESTLSSESSEQVDEEKVTKNEDLSSELESTLPQVNDQFQIFLDEFPKIELPQRIKACVIDYSDLTVFNEDNPSPYITDYAIALGQFKTNGNYIGTITLGAADCMLPIISTYKLNGERIDTKTIAIGYCGSAPCFECEEFMILQEDYQLYTSDTIKTVDCDDDYKPIVGTEKTEVIFRKGRLTESGMIELSDELKEVVVE